MAFKKVKQLIPLSPFRFALHIIIYCMNLLILLPFRFFLLEKHDESHKRERENLQD